jgi:primosomal protein N' (replication factor Y)
MFPNATVYEATQEKKPAISNRTNQIVVATPGSAPRLIEGYSGLLVLDCDVWLSAQTLNSEHKALRDWGEAIELLNPNARAVFAGLGGLLGKPLALWQHREIAKASYLDAKLLRLPPAVRTVSVSGTAEQINRVTELITAHGAQLIRNTGTKAAYRFDYSFGAKVCADLRSVAVSAKAIQRGSKNVRGLAIAMDDLEAI